MKIEAIRVLNYKGFADSGRVLLDRGWNVVVGQNNVGKSAFMESFQLQRIRAAPHRSLAIARGAPLPPKSKAEASITVSRSWFKNAWLATGLQLNLPVGFFESNGERVILDPHEFWSGEDLTFQLTFFDGNAHATWPSHGLFADTGLGFQSAWFNIDGDRQPDFAGVQNSASDNLHQIINANTDSHIYCFVAERLALGSCAFSDNPILFPNAANLAAVLNIFQGRNPDLWRVFQENVSAILPAIRHVSVVPKENNTLEIRLWSVEPETRRDDLAISLSDSGTGVGQVLAILYVAMTNEPGVIVIDEPNSFLHPGAAKKLIQILKNYNQHQYVISTHSAEVMAVAQPAKLHLVTAEDGRSQITSFSDMEVSTKRMLLEEIGASLSDLFGAERVIWVEGPTERECFTLIAAQVLQRTMIGVAFVAMRNVGDLEARKPQAAATLEIYEAISEGGSILPTTIAFSFDRECRTDEQVADLGRRLKGLAKVLPRRMTENYFLHPEAIVATLLDLGERDVSVERIRGLLDQFGPTYTPKSVTWGTEEATASVDAARLLTAVFHEASEARCEYRKVRDSVELLRWIIDNDLQHVDELVAYVTELLIQSEA